MATCNGRCYYCGREAYVMSFCPDCGLASCSTCLSHGPHSRCSQCVKLKRCIAAVQAAVLVMEHTAYGPRFIVRTGNP